jgi:hypothetical protein
VDKLVKAGYDEIVVVPPLLTEAYHAKVDVPRAIAEATSRHDDLEIRATAVLGLENVFLEVLDRRLRTALKEARVRELDALVLAAAGSSDQLANQAVARLARSGAPAQAAVPRRSPPVPRRRRGRAAFRAEDAAASRGLLFGHRTPPDQPPCHIGRRPAPPAGPEGGRTTSRYAGRGQLVPV